MLVAISLQKTKRVQGLVLKRKRYTRQHLEDCGLQLLLAEGVRAVPEHALILRQLRVDIHGVGPVVGGFGLGGEGSQAAQGEGDASSGEHGVMDAWDGD